MYLSCLILNPCNAQVRRELARPYEMHRTLLHAFTLGHFYLSRKEDDAAGVLFRVDERPRENVITVLVQSKFAPAWSYLSAQSDARGHAYLLPAAALDDGKPNPAVTRFELSQKIQVGQRLSFRLCANPTRRLGKSADRDKGKRVGIYNEDKQLEWLQRKAEANGFRIVCATVSRHEVIDDTIHRDDQTTHALKLLSAQFDGVLHVSDPVKLTAAVEAGIGSAKGFGFGLLSLAPA